LAAAAILDLFSNLVCPSLDDVVKRQKLWQIQNLAAQAAEIMKSV